MADFVAVLRNAIEGLNDNRPAIRQRLYERARLALATRLELVGPPPLSVVERHKRTLEDAIAEVESAYGEELQEPIAEPPNTFDYAHEARPRGDAALQREGAVPEASERATAEVEPQSISDPGELPNDLSTPDPSHLEVRGDAETPAYGKFSIEPYFGSRPAEIEPVRQIGFNCVREIAWASSSLCGLCQKWALCIDQSHCWHRTASANAAAPAPES